MCEGVFSNFLAQTWRKGMLNREFRYPFEIKLLPGQLDLCSHSTWRELLFYHRLILYTPCALSNTSQHNNTRYGLSLLIIKSINKTHYSPTSNSAKSLGTGYLHACKYLNWSWENATGGSKICTPFRTSRCEAGGYSSARARKPIICLE
jgi:hypothetical protein